MKRDERRAILTAFETALPKTYETLLRLGWGDPNCGAAMQYISIGGKPDEVLPALIEVLSSQSEIARKQAIDALNCSLPPIYVHIP